MKLKISIKLFRMEVGNQLNTGLIRTMPVSSYAMISIQLHIFLSKVGIHISKIP